jgi:hypothetical protein
MQSPHPSYEMLTVSSLENVFEAFRGEPWFKVIKIDPKVPLSEQQTIAGFVRLFKPEIHLESLLSVIQKAQP